MKPKKLRLRWFGRTYTFTQADLWSENAIEALNTWPRIAVIKKVGRNTHKIIHEAAARRRVEAVLTDAELVHNAPIDRNKKQYLVILMATSKLVSYAKYYPTEV